MKLFPLLMVLECFKDSSNSRSKLVRAKNLWNGQVLQLNRTNLTLWWKKEIQDVFRCSRNLVLLHPAASCLVLASLTKHMASRTVSLKSIFPRSSRTKLIFISMKHFAIHSMIYLKKVMLLWPRKKKSETYSKIIRKLWKQRLSHLKKKWFLYFSVQSNARSSSSVRMIFKDNMNMKLYC